MTTKLPTDPAHRKAAPVFSGVLMYFPDAMTAALETIKETAEYSFENKKHPCAMLGCELLGAAQQRGARSLLRSSWIASLSLIALTIDIEPNVSMSTFVDWDFKRHGLAPLGSALVAIAECSHAGNEQHNPGAPLHWDRSKSGDELDALTRHLLEAGTVDSDGIRHSTKVAWRALAHLQKEIEAERLAQRREPAE